MSRSWNSYTAPWPVIVYTVFSRVSWRMCRCASASVTFATTVVGPAASMRLTSACTWEGPTLEMKSRCTPTSGSPRSWKPQDESVIAVATAIQPKDARLNNNIHQPSGDHDHLLRLRLADESPDRFVCKRRLLGLFLRRIRRHLDMSAQLPVHLHHELDRILHERRRVHLRPRLVDEARAGAKLAPQGRGDVRNERREHEHRVLEHFLRHGARDRARVLQVRELVQELAHRGHGGIELHPPPVVVA